MSGDAGAATHEVRFYATLRRIVGARSVEIPVPPRPTVQSILDAVVARFPKLGAEILGEGGALSRHVHIFVNGRGVTYLPDGLATRVEPTTIVEFFPAVAGG